MVGKDASNPNIVFILSDDHGQWALGCYGNKEVKTPNLDRLANEGVLFSNFFCTSPVCSPARASILTGRIPSQHGVHDWIGAGSINVKDYEGVELNYKRYAPFEGITGKELEEIPNDMTIPVQDTLDYQRYSSTEVSDPIDYLEDQIAYTDILTDNGYCCGLSGKWHLGYSMKPQKSFSYWSVISKGGTYYKQPEYIRNGKIKFEQGYITDIITEDAINFIDKSHKAGKPFYVSLHYTAPHDPWLKEDQPEEIWNLYNSCTFESVPNEPLHPWQRKNRPIGEGKKRNYYLQGYYTTITAMDKNIGKIVDRLEEMGIKDNTLIVFTSDNGLNMGHHGIWGKGNGTNPQNMFDTSVKVPMIVSCPGKVAEGIVCNDLLSHYDFMPTLLDFVGIENSESENLPGKSFVPILRGEKMDKKENVVVYDEYGPVRMVRTKEWKYIHRYPFGPHELYDLANDPDEKVNLIDDSSKENVVISMKAMLEEWFIKYVNPEIDGIRDGVTGEGQFELAGIWGKGKKSFK